MGFRQGNYMTVWSSEPSKTGNTTRVRLKHRLRRKKARHTLL